LHGSVVDTAAPAGDGPIDHLGLTGSGTHSEGVPRRSGVHFVV
jgi:hypothetical protein